MKGKFCKYCVSNFKRFFYLVRAVTALDVISSKNLTAMLPRSHDSERRYVSTVGGSGIEGDTGTTGNWKHIPLSLSCQHGNIAVIFTIADVKSSSVTARYRRKNSDI